MVIAVKIKWTIASLLSVAATNKLNMEAQMFVTFDDRTSKKPGACRQYVRKDFSNVSFSAEKCSLVMEGGSQSDDDDEIEDLLMHDELSSSDESSTSDDSIELFIAASMGKSPADISSNRNKSVADNAGRTSGSHSAAGTSKSFAHNAASTSKSISDKATMKSVNKADNSLTATGKVSLHKGSHHEKSLNEAFSVNEPVTPSMFGPKTIKLSKPSRTPCQGCEKKLRTIQKLRERVKELEQQCEFLQEPHVRDLHPEPRKQSVLTDKLKVDLQHQKDKALVKYQQQLEQKEAARAKLVEDVKNYQILYQEMHSKLKNIDQQHQAVVSGLRAKIDAHEEELKKAVVKAKQDTEHSIAVLAMSNDFLAKENSQVKKELTAQMEENHRLMEENEKMADELFALMNSGDSVEEDSN
ncbi:uncharacterized protein LOC131958180 [Physella acuta]|uniref:uncharacterized protein LOC131958180 n=1 Tax=Physella acuta TaxID=109671 RepID=UPI0027DB6BE6|nr:uncharacterized protein LOC131958180 [Physella acuta]